MKAKIERIKGWIGNEKSLKIRRVDNRDLMVFSKNDLDSLNSEEIKMLHDFLENESNQNSFCMYNGRLAYWYNNNLFYREVKNEIK